MTGHSTDLSFDVPVGSQLPDTTPEQLGRVVAVSMTAAVSWADSSPAARGRALDQVADAIDAVAPDLSALADDETRLGRSRLSGEVERTTFQLRMFAELLRSGDASTLIVDPALDGPPPRGHPELRRAFVPVGPVAVFGASNFPFAFGVAGGDTASALAAGCPVVAKAHPYHPRTSEAVATLIVDSLLAAGAPAGTFALVRGFDAGRLLMGHPGIRAAAFTGSNRGGRALFDLANARPDPIPFYGELGSVNPVVVTSAAAGARKDLADGFVTSLNLGSGQFCTKPGLLFAPVDSGLTQAIIRAVSEATPGPMLHPDIAERYRATLSKLGAVHGARTFGHLPSEPGDQDLVGPAIVVVNAQTARDEPTLLHTECFGPAAVVVEYDDDDQLTELLTHLEGCLVATVHAQEGEPVAAQRLSALARIAGRIVWNGWPTGVAISPAQHHGGPHPASTNPLYTSVGTSAIDRFRRPVTYQDVPRSHLPDHMT